MAGDNVIHIKLEGSSSGGGGGGGGGGGAPKLPGGGGKAPQSLQQQFPEFFKGAGMVSQVGGAAGIPGIGAAGSVLGAVGAAAGPLAAVAAVATAAILGIRHAVNSTLQMMEEFANRLAPYSGDLSQAKAMSEVNQIMGDMRRAQLLGPDLSRFVNAQSRFEQAKEDLTAELIKPLIPVAEAFFKMAADFINWVREFLRDTADKARSIDDTTAMLMGTIIPGFPLLVKYMQKLDVNTQRPNEDQESLDLLFKVKPPDFQAGVGGFNEQAQEKMNQGPMNIPAFGGF